MSSPPREGFLLPGNQRVRVVDFSPADREGLTLVLAELKLSPFGAALGCLESYRSQSNRG